MSSAAASKTHWLDRIPDLPDVDPSDFGPVETQSLPRRQQIAASFMARNWLRIPHVTHHDKACIDALEQQRAERGSDGGKMSHLPFLIRAVVAALKAFPRFNASLDKNGTSLLVKRYFHIGVAVALDDGLVVPVIRDCDQKSLEALESEVADKAERARGKGLPMEEMVGGCFSISSLGSQGGTGFTPIINAPEVAILGVSRVQSELALDAQGSVVERAVLPLSLSYNHRVINGADAARFTRFLVEQLENPTALDAD
ncbi:MAG: 2-oxo acid dehydrogenase subunit E2 [Algiphilus sp.]